MSLVRNDHNSVLSVKSFGVSVERMLLSWEESIALSGPLSGVIHKAHLWPWSE